MPKFYGTKKSSIPLTTRYISQSGSRFIAGKPVQWFNLLEPITRDCYLAKIERLRKQLVLSTSQIKIMR